MIAPWIIYVHPSMNIVNLIRYFSLVHNKYTEKEFYFQKAELNWVNYNTLEWIKTFSREEAYESK